MDNKEHIIEDDLMPVGKKKVFVMGVKWFFGSLVAISVAHWAILDPLKLSEHIFTATIWATIYYWFVNFAIALGITALRFSNYYRYIYHLYRKHALVDNFYPSRAILQDGLHQVLEGTQTRFHVMGLSLHTLLQSPEIRSLVSHKAQNGKVQFRFLLHHPDCKFLKERAQMENKEINQISKDAGKHLDQLVSMKKELKNNGADIEIKTLKDKMPDCFFLLADDTLYIGPYLYGRSGRDCPIFSIHKNAINKKIFERYIHTMQEKWIVANNIA